MKLRSLELAEFRKFDRPVRIGELGDGINVLCGPNEFGKSTLLAAIRGVLFERHTSKAESVRRMRHHRGETSPRIAMTFETDRGLHRIEKRFLHREPFARLTLPDGSRIEGDSAEEALQALLGFRGAGKQGSRPEDAGMWGALWVTQRSSLDQPEFSDPARTTLHACLEAEIGAFTGGERGQGIMRDVREALFCLRDGRGQPKGRLKEAGEQLATADAELLRLADRHRALTDDIEALQRCRRTLARASDADEAARLEADLADARTRRDVVLRFEDQHRQAALALRLAEAARAAAVGEAARRAQRHRSLDVARCHAVRAAAKDREALAALAVADAELGGLSASLAEAQRAADAAAGRLRRARLVADLAARAAQATGLADRLAQAESAQAEANECTGELAALRADADAIQAVHAAALGLAQARAVLNAQGTTISLDLEPGSYGRVLIDGAPAVSGEVRAVADVTLEIPGIGRILIRPGIKDRHTIQSGIAAAERTLAEALDAVGATDEADAERRRLQRVSCEQRLQQARRALALYAPADPGRGLAAGADALRNHLAVLRRRLKAELAELDLAEPHSPAAADDAVQAGLSTEADTAAALASAHAALIGPRQRRAQLAEDAARAAALRVAADAEVERLEREAAEAVLQEADEGVVRRQEDAAREVIAKQDELALVERSKPEDTLPAINARIARFEQAIAHSRETQRALRQEIAVRQSRIEQEEGGGVEELIAAAGRSREELKRTRDALQREAEVLELLRDVLSEAEQAAKERYLAPVVRRVTPYLQGLFPGALVHCDEAFRVTGVTRDGAIQEEFARLSDGTQEQIAILSRLAFADMLIEAGRPAMVILDDALAFADRDRMDRMFDLLTEAARRMQLLVLTCRGDVFTRLGGRRLELRTVAGAESSCPAVPYLS